MLAFNVGLAQLAAQLVILGDKGYQENLINL